MEACFEYAVLRLTPDPTRGERVNIGIAVFLPDRVDVRLAPSLLKVRALDGRVELDRLYELPSLVEKWTAADQTTEARHQALLALGLVETTQRGWFRPGPDADYERQVARLMATMVTPPPRPRRRDLPDTGLERALKEHFARRQLLGQQIEDIDRHRIIHRYPVALDENLYADFAIKNGAWQVTATLDLRAKPEAIRTEKFKQAAVKAVTLDRATRRLKGCTPLVVYAAEPAAIELTQHHINLLSEYAERVYNFLDPEDARAYLGRMEQAAGAPPIFD